MCPSFSRQHGLLRVESRALKGLSGCKGQPKIWMPTSKAESIYSVSTELRAMTQVGSPRAPDCPALNRATLCARTDGTHFGHLGRPWVEPSLSTPDVTKPGPSSAGLSSQLHSQPEGLKAMLWPTIPKEPTCSGPQEQSELEHR